MRKKEEITQEEFDRRSAEVRETPEYKAAYEEERRKYEAEEAERNK